MANKNKPSLDNKIQEIVKNAKNLEEVQKNLRELIGEIFICLFDSKREKSVTDKDIASFSRINFINLLVVTFWDEKFSEGRIWNFLPCDKAENFENLAELNLHIFGRGTTLNERLLSFAENNRDKNYVKLGIHIDNGDLLKCSVNEERAIIHIGENIWEKLGNIDNTDYNKFRESVLEEGQLLDGARVIRNTYGKELRKCRLEAVVNNWRSLFKREKDEQDFFKLLYLTTPNNEIQKYRESQGLEKINSSEQLFLGTDFGLVDNFVSFLQALAHFYQNAKVILGTCRAWERKSGILYPEYGCAVNLISENENFKIKNNTITKIMDLAEKIARIIKIQDSLYIKLPLNQNETNLIQKKGNKSFQDNFQQALNDPNLDRELKEKIEDKLKDSRGLKNLLNAVGLLSSKVHEGCKLSFTFLYGGGTSWRIIEDTLSEEEKGKYQLKIKLPEDFAKVVEEHWSVFQGERVAGFIDATKLAHNEAEIPFTKIVRLNPYHTLPGPLFKECVRISHDSLIIYSSGNGKVRVFSFEEDKKVGREMFRWDTINNKIEKTSWEVNQIADDILKLLSI